RLAMADRPVRGQAVRAVDPLHRGVAARRLLPRPYPDGGPRRAVQRTAIDDHRLVSLAKGAPMSLILTRRATLGGLLAGGSALLTGCDKLAANEDFRSVLFSAENMHRWMQR